MRVEDWQRQQQNAELGVHAHDLHSSVFRCHQDSDRTMPAGYPELAPAFPHSLLIVPLHD